jgi:hypothetical protein
MPNQQDFRRFAEQRWRLADGSDAAARDGATDRTASDRLALAVDEEGIADLIRAVDELLSATGKSLNAGRRHGWKAAAISRCHRALQLGWRVPEVARGTIQKVMHDN